MQSGVKSDVKIITPSASWNSFSWLLRQSDCNSVKNCNNIVIFVTEMALRVVVTGGAGQVAYSLLYPIANGDVFGKDQKVELVLLDIAPMMKVLSGVVMELQDCALPLVTDIVATVDPDEAFKDSDVVLMVGSIPRKEGKLVRKDLLKANARIFEAHGKSLDAFAKKTVKVLVVGNPANTICVLTLRSAPSIPVSNFTCLTRLDMNRAQAQVSKRLGLPCKAVRNLIIWGNHSSTQFPDAAHATVVAADGSVSTVYDAVKDDAWLTGEFIETVQLRGNAIVEARNLTSAMSAAKAIGDHMRDWWFGTKENEWVSMGVLSDGTKYGIPEGIVYSMPVKIGSDKSWSVVDDLDISDFARSKMDATAKELVEEKDIAVQFLSSA